MSGKSQYWDVREQIKRAVLQDDHVILNALKIQYPETYRNVLNQCKGQLRKKREVKQ